MSTSSETVGQPAGRPNGLITSLKVLYAPTEAFATLSRVPMWGWAALIGLVLTLVGAYILLPASNHYAHIAQEQRLAQMPADQAAQARQAIAKFPQALYSVFALVGAFIFSWFFWIVTALIFLVAAALGGGEARFVGAWVSAVNLYIILALGSLINSVIVTLRGVGNINSISDLYGIPSLAMLAHGSPKMMMFLYTFNIINIWLWVVTVIALEQVLKMSRGAAIVTTVILALIGAGFAVLFAR